ncbi:hypothetical protein [Amycolatopsis sp. H20-H5]|uniref:hypothetical protein n=1 Tax=Amycolatopsis sp. H20-H5 TaxID=3046309 RepID=UPI002DBBA8AF|nr:hypothetical protein [Amycolatopsis sp. H20-H5]MEC3981868.1 hypothetical protein [Amycolatopsis sp. H20-H5]
MKPLGEVERDMLLLDAKALLLEWRRQVAPGVSLGEVAGADSKWTTGIHREYLLEITDRLGGDDVTPARFPPGLAGEVLREVLGRVEGREKGKETAPLPTLDDGESEAGTFVVDSDTDSEEGSFIVNDDDDDDDDESASPAFMDHDLTFASPGDFREHLRAKMPLKGFILSSRNTCKGFVARSVDHGGIPVPGMVNTGAFPQFSFPDVIKGQLVNDTFNTRFGDPQMRDLLLADSEKQRLQRMLALQRNPGRRGRLAQVGESAEPAVEGLRDDEREDPEAGLPVLDYEATIDQEVSALHRRPTFRRKKGWTRVKYGDRVIGRIPRRPQNVGIGIMCKFVTYRVVKIGQEQLDDSDRMPLMVGAREGGGFTEFRGVTGLVVVVPTDAPVRFTFNLVLQPMEGNVLGSSYPRVFLDWRAQPTGPGGDAPHAGVGGRFEIDLINRELTGNDYATRQYFGVH